MEVHSTKISFKNTAQRLLLVLCLIRSIVSFGSGLHPDTIALDVSQLDNEPQFLYEYLEISEVSDVERVEEVSFSINSTKQEFSPNLDYWVRLRLTNSARDSSRLLINFSPNDWNESWELINAKVYNDDNELIDINKTGSRYKADDKPVQSVMNLMKLVVPPQEQLEIIVRLQGISDSTRSTPSYIDFVLLKEDQGAGLISGYPFTGTYVNRKSLSAFVANHLINHEIFRDEKEIKTIDEIEESWESLDTKDLFEVLPEVGVVYWLKLSLVGTPHFNGRQIFEISTTPYWGKGSYSPVADQFSYDYIDGYYRNAAHELIHQQVGDHVNERDRPLKFWANFLTIDIAIGDSIDFYVRLEGADERFLMTSLVMYHVDPTSIFPGQVNEGWTHGLYYGALGIYLLFFSLLYVVEREQLYLFFSISILGLLMINIFPEDIYTQYVVFPGWRDYHVPLYFMGFFTLSFGFLKFTEKFLLIDKSSILSRFIIPGFLAIFGIASMLCAISFKYIPEIGNPAFEPYMLCILFLQLVSILLPLVIALVAGRKKNVSKAAYFISFLPLVIAGVFHFGKIITPTFFNVQGYQSLEEVHQSFSFIQIGVATMLTLFAMNVGFRTNRLKTEKEQAEKIAEKNVIIEAKSKQNETLLKEIHHRVKNNLQTISSLLYLQSYGEENQETKENLALTQQRVESMALIHKNLYQRDNLAAIEMKEYIKNLAESLISSYQTSTNKVKLIMDMPEYELDIDRAIPLGLIINEIITNSLKYAFPSNHEGALSVYLTKSDDSKTSILIADNGIGKSNDATSSFGTQLVRLLTKQINATISSGNDNGHWIRMTWNDEDY